MGQRTMGKKYKTDPSPLLWYTGSGNWCSPRATKTSVNALVPDSSPNTTTRTLVQDTVGVQGKTRANDGKQELLSISMEYGVLRTSCSSANATVKVATLRSCVAVAKNQGQCVCHIRSRLVDLTLQKDPLTMYVQAEAGWTRRWQTNSQVKAAPAR